MQLSGLYFNFKIIRYYLYFEDFNFINLINFLHLSIIKKPFVIIFQRYYLD
jgi:hypothetical protein